MALYQEVPDRLPDLQHGPVQIGAPPLAQTQIQAARLLHFVRGRGYSVVPWHCCDVELTSGSETLRYRSEPSGQAIARVWAVALRNDGGGAVDINPAALTARRVSPPSDRRAAGQAPFMYIEPLAAKSSALQELTFTVAHVSGSKSYIDAIGCWELPRQVLKVEASGDLGIDMRSLEPGRPIAQLTDESLHALAKRWAATTPRRASLFAQWFTVAKVTSGSYVDLFKLAPRVVPMKIYRSDTVRSVRVDLYARVSDNTTKADFKAYSGASSRTISLDGVANVADRSFRWIGGTGPDVFNVPCEDFTDDAGLPSGAFPTFGVQVRRTAGSGNAEIKGVCLWEYGA